MYPDNMVQLAVRMYLYRWNDRLQEDATTAPYEARDILCHHLFFSESRGDYVSRTGCASALLKQSSDLYRVVG